MNTTYAIRRMSITALISMTLTGGCASGFDAEDVVLFGADADAAPPCVEMLQPQAGDPREGLQGLARGFDCLARYHGGAYPVSAALYRLAAEVMDDAANDPATIEASAAWRKTEQIREAAEARVRQAERAQAEAERDAERAENARRNAAITQGFRAAISIASAAASEDSSQISAAVSEAVVSTAAMVVEAREEAREASEQIAEMEVATAEIRAAYDEIVSAARAISFSSPVDHNYAGDMLIVARLVALRLAQNPCATLARLEVFGRDAAVVATDPFLSEFVANARSVGEQAGETLSESAPSEAVSALVRRLGRLEVVVAKYERWREPTPRFEDPPLFDVPDPPMPQGEPDGVAVDSSDLPVEVETLGDQGSDAPVPDAGSGDQPVSPSVEEQVNGPT